MSRGPSVPRSGCALDMFFSSRHPPSPMAPRAQYMQSALPPPVWGGLATPGSGVRPVRALAKLGWGRRDRWSIHPRPKLEIFPPKSIALEYRLPPCTKPAHPSPRKIMPNKRPRLDAMHTLRHEPRLPALDLAADRRHH